jgi:hypothetical protein
LNHFIVALGSQLIFEEPLLLIDYFLCSGPTGRTILPCSRDSIRALFRLVIGGYGLLAIGSPP